MTSLKYFKTIYIERKNSSHTLDFKDQFILRIRNQRERLSFFEHSLNSLIRSHSAEMFLPSVHASSLARICILDYCLLQLCQTMFPIPCSTLWMYSACSSRTNERTTWASRLPTSLFLSFVIYSAINQFRKHSTTHRRNRTAILRTLIIQRCN